MAATPCRAWARSSPTSSGRGRPCAPCTRRGAGAAWTATTSPPSSPSWAGAWPRSRGVDPDPAAWAQAAELEDRADDALAGLYRRRAGLALTDADFYRAVRAREYLLPEDFVALAEALPAGDPVVPAPAVPLVLSGIVTEPWLLETLADAGPGSSRTTWAAAPAGCCRPRPSPTRTRRGRTGSCAGPLTRPAPIPSPTGWTASGTWSRCPGPAGC